MTTNDPIADMLTRIRNANTAKHDVVDVPASKMKVAIADILVNEGYVEKYEFVENKGFQDIRITLKYGATKNDRILSGLKRISKPGLRIYAGNEGPRRPRHCNHLHKPGRHHRQGSAPFRCGR